MEMGTKKKWYGNNERQIDDHPDCIGLQIREMCERNEWQCLEGWMDVRKRPTRQHCLRREGALHRILQGFIVKSSTVSIGDDASSSIEDAEVRKSLGDGLGGPLQSPNLQSDHGGETKGEFGL